MRLKQEMAALEEASLPPSTEVILRVHPSIIYRVIYYVMAFWMTFASAARLIITLVLERPLDVLPFIGFSFGAVALLAAILGLDREA